MKASENLDISSTVEIEFSTSKIANSVRAALQPDNSNFPKGLSIVMVSCNNKLIIKVNCNSGMATFINTLDEILEHIQIVEGCNTMIDPKLIKESPDMIKEMLSKKKHRVPF